MFLVFVLYLKSSKLEEKFLCESFQCRCFISNRNGSDIRCTCKLFFVSLFVNCVHVQYWIISYSDRTNNSKCLHFIYHFVHTHPSPVSVCISDIFRKLKKLNTFCTFYLLKLLIISCHWNMFWTSSTRPVLKRQQSLPSWPLDDVVLYYKFCDQTQVVFNMFWKRQQSLPSSPLDDVVLYYKFCDQSQVVFNMFWKRQQSLQSWYCDMY